jgi:hypothetical protein
MLETQVRCNTQICFNLPSHGDHEPNSLLFLLQLTAVLCLFPPPTDELGE